MVYRDEIKLPLNTGVESIDQQFERVVGYVNIRSIEMAV